MLVARSVLALSILAVAPTADAANQVVSNCSNDTELRADLATMQAGDGGTLTFACNTSTIVLTADLPTITTATTVDGGNKITISGGNSRRIFLVSGGASLTLERIVLSNGSSTQDGGAIASSGTLVLQDMIIRDSSSQLSGGALVAYGPTLIQNTEIANNVAASGAAAYARFEGAPLTIEDSWIHHNESTSGSFGGAAVFLWDGADVTIRDSELSYNEGARGGAIHTPFSNSSVTIEGSRLHHNAAVAGGGGAIAMSGGPLTVVDSELSENTTITGGGGLLYEDGTSVDIRQTTFHANEALSAGGALNVDQSTGVLLLNVTLSQNEAFSAGALMTQLSTVALTNTTIASNIAGDDGGGIYQTSGTVLLRNTLLADNVGDNCVLGGGFTVSQGGNVSSDASCSTGLNQNTDENEASTELGPLAMNGGPTPTHVPQPGSDAIDAGILADAPEVDQRGADRLEGASVDAGSVEVATCPDEVMCGDANQTSSLSTADAFRALQFSVGSPVSCPLWLCDYNGTGDVSASDALGILRAAVGLPTSPECPDAWDCHALD